MSFPFTTNRDDVNFGIGSCPASGAVRHEGDVRQGLPSHEGGRFTAHLHHDVAVVEALWRRFEAEGACSAFQQLAWATLIRDRIVRPTGAELLVVEVANAITKRPIMLLPLVGIRERAHTVIEGLDLGVSDYTAPLLSPECVITRDDVGEVWTAVKAVLPKTDLVRLTRIPAKIFATANPLVGLPACRPMDIEAFGVALDGDPDTLIQRLCRKSTFRDFAKFRRRLERHGKVSLLVPDTPRNVDFIFDALVEQRRHRFQEIGRPDLLSRNEFVAFYRAAAQQGLNGGSARIFGLLVNEQCVGTALGMIYRDAFHLLIQTMDGNEPWRNCSPGLQVTAEVMTWSLREKLRYFDFTIGMLPYKLEFGATSSPLFELTEAQTIRGHIILHFARALKHAKAWLRHYPTLLQTARMSKRALGRRAADLRIRGRTPGTGAKT